MIIEQKVLFGIMLFPKSLRLDLLIGGVRIGREFVPDSATEEGTSAKGLGRIQDMPKMLNGVLPIVMRREAMAMPQPGNVVWRNSGGFVGVCGNHW